MNARDVGFGNCPQFALSSFRESASVISLITDRIAQRQLRKLGIRSAIAPSNLPRRAELVLEEGVSLSQCQLGFRSLEVGACSYLRSGTELLNVGSIGRFCSVANDVVIGQDRAAHPVDWVSSHPFQFEGTELSYAPQESPAKVGHDVWLGRGAMIMESVTIGTGAIIASRALVTRDVPPYAIVGGIPARVIRYRHPPSIVDALLACRWWMLPLTELRALPLDQPDAFIAKLEALDVEAACYRRLKMTRSGVQHMDVGGGA